MHVDLTFVTRYGLAVLFTALSYFIGIFLVEKRAAIISPLVIGLVVVTIGYLTKYFRAPLALVIAMPIPFGIILLWYSLKKKTRKTVLAYLTTWVAYALFHVILSAFFLYDSLIPAWHLHP